MRRLATILVTGVLLSAGASPTTARISPAPLAAIAEGTWWERTDPGRGALPKSRFYRLRSDLSAADTKPYGQHLDTIYLEYKKRLGGLEQRTPEALDVLIFANQQEYIDTLRERFSINATGSGGMFFVTPRGSALAFWVGGLPRSRVLHVIQHEGFHQFASSRFGPEFPMWLNEGLAEFFGESIVVDGTVVIGQTSDRTLRSLRDAINANKHIRFRDMLTMDGERWNASVRNGSAMLQYMQAWSMVHFLVYGDGGKYQAAFERYLSLLNRGAKGYEAFVQAFGTDDIESFETRWIEHAKTARPSAFVTAMERIQFLAEGMKQLAAKGIVPATMDELQDALKAAKFETQISGGGGAHGQMITLSASDDSNFQLPDDDLAKGTPLFELTPPKVKRGTSKKEREMEARSATPPSLSTKYLAPRNLTVRWTRARDTGELVYDVDLK